MWPFSKKKKPVKQQRAYKSASTSNLAYGWATSAVKPDADIRQGLRSLRIRSREQYQNNDHAHKFINMIKTNVVGHTGIVMQARTKFVETGKPDDVANNALERAWKDWGRAENCDVAGTRTWKVMQGLIATSCAMDGEVIIHKSTGGKYRFQLDLIDPELLNIDYNRSDLTNGNFIRMGIEFNRAGKPVAYHITQDNRAQDWYQYQGTGYRRIPANQIIHKFLYEFVGQTRGVPWMSSALMRMKILDGYEEAAVVAARFGAAKMGFFYSETGDGEYIGDDVDAYGNIIDEVEPGAMTELPKGVRFESFDPTYPHQQFPDFVKACMRGIASGLGVSYNSLSGDLESVNFSSMRTGVLDEREVWKGLQEWMIESICEPVYEGWLRNSLLAGVIKIGKAALDPVREDKYLEVVWQARRWSWVDPKKDMDANVAAIENGIRSRSDVIRESGRDPDDVWQEIARENERMKELGIELAAKEAKEPVEPKEVEEDEQIEN